VGAGNGGLEGSVIVSDVGEGGAAAAVDGKPSQILFAMFAHSCALMSLPAPLSHPGLRWRHRALLLLALCPTLCRQIAMEQRLQLAVTGVQREVPWKEARDFERRRHQVSDGGSASGANDRSDSRSV
jgi:hypothetical protein